PQKLAKLRRKLQEAESAKALKVARKSAARATGKRKEARPSASVERKSPAATADAKEASPTKKLKKKLNLSPERRAQLAAAMKAAEGGAISTDKNSPTPPTQPPENRADGV